MYQLSDKCVYVYCVESFAHIECDNDCSRRERHLVDPHILFFLTVMVFLIKLPASMVDS